MSSTGRVSRGGAPATPRYRWGRRIGPWGTTTRLVAGAAAVAWALAVPHENPVFDLPGAGHRLWGSVFGIVVLPALLTLVVAFRGRAAPPLRLGHGYALGVTVVVVLLAQVFPVAILVGIGGTLLLLAVRGQGGCELMTVPNLALRRHDYLVCLPFTPIDTWERARREGRR